MGWACCIRTAQVVRLTIQEYLGWSVFTLHDKGHMASAIALAVSVRDDRRGGLKKGEWDKGRAEVRRQQAEKAGKTWRRKELSMSVTRCFAVSSGASQFTSLTNEPRPCPYRPVTGFSPVCWSSDRPLGSRGMGVIVEVRLREGSRLHHVLMPPLLMWRSKTIQAKNNCECGFGGVCLNVENPQRMDPPPSHTLKFKNGRIFTTTFFF